MRRIKAMPRGFTLFELLLVLAVLVILAAIALPTLSNVLDNHRLRKSGDVIRAEWNRVRNRAMKSGKIHVFRCQPGGNQYRFEIWSAEDEGDSLANGFPASDAANSAAAELPAHVRQLPEGVHFVNSQSQTDSRAAVALSKQDQQDDPTWSQPVLFYPDGTSSNTELVLSNVRQYCLRLKLRGMTGSAQVSDLMTFAELSSGP